MNNFRISIFAILLSGSLLLFGSFSMDLNEPRKAKATMKSISPDQDEYVFWFFLRIRIDDRKKQFKITGPGSRSSSGMIADFEKSLWRGLGNRQIAIGPFSNYEEAENARLMYQKSKEKVFIRRTENAPDEVNWFLITFKNMKRLGSYQLVSMPARVASGSASGFVDALYEGVAFKSLAIGPFWDYTLAEEAKKMYGKNE